MLGFKLVSEKVNSRLVSHLSLLEVSIRDFDTQEGRWLPLVVHVLLNLVKVVLDDLLWVCLQDIHDAENCSIRDLLIEIQSGVLIGQVVPVEFEDAALVDSDGGLL